MYARQSGTSAIFVHDDGLQSMSEEEKEKRISFYADHNIVWVARPPHSNDPDGYKRAGRFEKASNMKYDLQVCIPLTVVSKFLNVRAAILMHGKAHPRSRGCR